MISSGGHPPGKICATFRREDVARIIAAVTTLADEPLPHGSQKLTGSARSYRIRVGDYRVVYELLRDASVIEIQRVRHRKDVYR